jgi:uncharacterized protein (TIGR02147 family)
MLPNVFDYTSYRDFLRDFYEAKKAENKNYSYQCMAMRAGFKSKASFANIISCGQPLASRRSCDVAGALGLGKRETDYFDALVHFNNAATVEEKELHFERMRSLTPKSKAVRLQESQYDFYSNWYHCAVRELVTQIDFKDDFALLAKTMDPPITPVQARRSVELLVGLGMIEKMDDGRYRQSQPVITAADAVTTLAIQNFHREFLSLAAESISRHPKNIREVSAITAGLSRKSFQRIQDELRQFRRRLLDIVADESSPEAVYQIAFQMFPLSKISREWRENYE